MAGTCRYGAELSCYINVGNFLNSGKVYWLASQEGLCSMEKVSSSHNPLYSPTDPEKREQPRSAVFDKPKCLVL